MIEFYRTCYRGGSGRRWNGLESLFEPTQEGDQQRRSPIAHVENHLGHAVFTDVHPFQRVFLLKLGQKQQLPHVLDGPLVRARTGVERANLGGSGIEPGHDPELAHELREGHRPQHHGIRLGEGLEILGPLEHFRGVPRVLGGLLAVVQEYVHLEEAVPGFLDPPKVLQNRITRFQIVDQEGIHPEPRTEKQPAEETYREDGDYRTGPHVDRSLDSPDDRSTPLVRSAFPWAEIGGKSEQNR